jgi:hypothetical protein
MSRSRDGELPRTCSRAMMREDRDEYRQAAGVSEAAAVLAARLFAQQQPRNEQNNDYELFNDYLP